MSMLSFSLFLFKYYNKMIHTIFFDFMLSLNYAVKFMFSKKATKIDKIFTADLTLCSTCQIDGEDFINFCGLLRKHELYVPSMVMDVVRLGQSIFDGTLGPWTQLSKVVHHCPRPCPRGPYHSLNH